MPDLEQEFYFEGFSAPQPELFREVAPEAPFFEHVPQLEFSFLSAERRRVYSTILYYFLLRRRAHEIESYHNDIFDAVQPTIENIILEDYSISAFRADMDQLVAWNNLERRLEPYRLKKISDRRLKKYLYKLTETSKTLIESLETLKAPHEIDRVMLDQDHLTDIEEFLDRAEDARKQKDGIDEDGLRRLARIFGEIDNKCKLISIEITEFGAKIATFNTSPFQLESLPEIIDWLDRYVDQYLQRVAKKGPMLYHRLIQWEFGNSRELLDSAFESAREHFLTNPLAGPWVSQIKSSSEILSEIVPFFAPEGLFAELCQRVNEHVRDLVRKIRRHLDDIRRRNIRIQALRRRTKEVVNGKEDALESIRSWLKELLSSAHQLTDAGGGTPSRRVAPPRPTYWRRRVARTPFQAAFIKKKQGSLERTHELEKAQLNRLSEFINKTLLKGKKRAKVSDVALETPADVRSFLDSVKKFKLGRKKVKEQLLYEIIYPKGAEDKPANFDGKKWRFSSPDYQIKKKS